jgi:hypothetical protein
MVLGLQGVALTSDQLAPDAEVGLPVQLLVAKNFSHRHAAWGEPFEEQQVGLRMEIDGCALHVTRSSMRDEWLGNPFKQPIIFDVKALLVHSWRT